MDNGLTTDACGICNWPENEHNNVTGRCPDYGSSCSLTGWLDTRYRQKQLVLTQSVMVHMLADIDQIVTEMQQWPDQKPLHAWVDMLRHAVDGKDYER